MALPIGVWNLFEFGRPQGSPLHHKHKNRAIFKPKSRVFVGAALVAAQFSGIFKVPDTIGHSRQLKASERPNVCRTGQYTHAWASERPNIF